MQTRSSLIALLALVSLGSLTAQVTPTTYAWKIETGFGYSEGDYGLNADTEVYSAPVSLVYDAANWSLRATVPWVSVKGPAVVPGVGGRPTSGEESGIGDSTLGLTYKLFTAPDSFIVNLSGRVKFHTGDEDRGLSTGGTDYYTQVDVLRSYGSVTPFVSLGYRWMGSSPLYQLEDGVFASGGVAFRVAEGTSIGAAYEWREEIVAGGDASSEVSAFAFRKFSDRWSGSIYALAGFTDASPNHSFGGSVIFSF
ncbi:transporter [Oleiharenicola lentus]|uniref:transporter n=1 Tax=Oleiharenicola lentus TaxID=2508720 RepID=UPI003F663015